MKQVRRSWLLLLVLAFGGLACAASGWRSGTPERLPRSVFPALCEVFRADPDYDPTTITIVLAQTEPIYQTFALRVLRGAGALTPIEADQDDARDRELGRVFEPTAVRLPAERGNCSWQLSAQLDDAIAGRLVLELSNVVPDPFSDGTFGLFARHSLGGSAAAWYWIELENRAAHREVAGVYELEISDG